MANWAITDYVIEGSKESLKRIYDAIKNHEVEEESDNNWEGNILNALGIDWDRELYMRGFIRDIESINFNPDTDAVLPFYAEEAWGATDFNIALEEGIPDIKVYFSVIEEGGEVYATNDAEGKYFTDRYYVDTCIDGDYNSEFFSSEKSIYQWLSNITNGKIKSKEDVAKFNSESEDSDNYDENYIYIHEFKIIK
jgi:hypothetical protein